MGSITRLPEDLEAELGGLRRVGGKELREVFHRAELFADCPRCGDQLDGRYVYVDDGDPVLWEYSTHTAGDGTITLRYHVDTDSWYRKPAGERSGLNWRFRQCRGNRL